MSGLLEKGMLGGPGIGQKLEVLRFLEVTNRKEVQLEGFRFGPRKGWECWMEPGSPGVPAKRRAEL